jgi:hypothetical protein
MIIIGLTLNLNHFGGGRADWFDLVLMIRGETDAVVH